MQVGLAVVVALVLGAVAPAHAYDRQAAVLYADEFWGGNGALPSYNPAFNWYLSGGNSDCANFISQTHIAGNRRFDSATGFLDNKGSLPRVEDLEPELANRGGATGFTDYTNPELPLNLIRGNPIFIHREGGGYARTTHATVVIGVDNIVGGSALTFDAHTTNRFHAPYRDIPTILGDWFVVAQYLRYWNLQDAPIIKYVSLTQMVEGQEKTLETWVYDDDYNPFDVRPDYYFNTYNGLHPASSPDKPLYAKAGELKLTIVFDATMRQNNIAVTMGTNNPDYNQLQFTTVEWTRTHQFSDTWTGKVTIPEGGLAANGLNFIKVNAFAADGSQTNQNSYLNGYVPAPDTNHVVRVDTLPPTVVAFAADGRPIGGHKTYNTPTVLIAADDDFDGSGVASVQIDGPGGYSESQPYDPSQVLAEPRFPLSPTAILAEGDYVVTAIDAAGNKGYAYFTVRATPLTLQIGTLPILPDETYLTEGKTLLVSVIPPTRTLVDVELFQEDASGVLTQVDVANDDAGLSTPVTFPFATGQTELPEGDYVVTIRDNEGNSALGNATIDRTPPSMTVAYPSGVPNTGMTSKGPINDFQQGAIWLHNDLTVNSGVGIRFSLADNLGVSKFFLGQSSLDPATATTDATFNPPVSNTEVGSVDTKVLPDGRGYAAYVEDQLGHQAGINFGVDSVPPGVQRMDIVSAPDLSVKAIMDATDAGSGVSNLATVVITTGAYDYPTPTNNGLGQSSFHGSVNIPVGFNADSPNSVEARYYVAAVDASGLANLLNPVVVEHNLFAQRGLSLTDYPANAGWFSFGQESIGTGGGHGQPFNTNLGSILRNFAVSAVQCVPINPADSCSSSPPPICPLHVKLTVQATNTPPAGAPASVNYYTSGGDTPSTVVFDYTAGGDNTTNLLPKFLAPVSSAKLDVSGGDACFRAEGMLTYDLETLGANGQLGAPQLTVPAGRNVVVSAGGVSVTFANVSPGPNNTFTLIRASPPPPPGFRYLPGENTVPDLVISANYSGPLDVTLSYIPGGLTPEQQKFLRLFHFVNGGWQDITTLVDSNGNVVRGTANSASPFGIFISTGVLSPDAAPPATALNIQGVVAPAPGGASYASTRAKMTLQATDSDSGVRATYYAVNPSQALLAAGLNAFTVGQFVSYQAGTSLYLPEGARTLAFASVDRAGNYEALNVRALLMDGTAPSVTFFSSAPYFALSATDPVSNGVASGLSGLFYIVDKSPNDCPALFTDTSAPTGTCANPAYSRPFALAVGTHTVYYQAQDAVQNGADLVYSSSVVVGAAPPVTTLTISTPSFGASPVYVSTATTFALSAGDGSGPGVARTLYAIDAATFTTYAGTFTLVAQGTHTIQFYSVDALGVAEAVRSTAVAVDAAPPLTASVLLGGRQAPGAAGIFVSSDTRVGLAATDPTVSGVASGVAFTRWQDNAGAFQIFVSSFALAEGSHTLTYQSQDNVGNLEVLSSTAILVDATPPVSTAAIGAPQYAAPGGLLFVGPAATFALTAQDPVVQGVASGVSAVSVRVDSAPFTFYSTTFTLSPGDGLRTVSWFAVDNVGNAETPKVSAVALDSTPPLTSLLVSGGRQFPGPDASTFYASTDTRLVLISTDPLVGGVASGVAFTRWQDNGGAFQTYLFSVSFAEGAHKFAYQSSDNVANLEILRSTDVWIDATPPVTTVSIGSPTFTAADGTIYVATATPISFAAADPNLPTGQAGSGLSRIETSLDGAAFLPYAAVLTLAEGRHVILYRAVDDVGNVEGAHSISIQSDATPPVSSLVIGQPQFQLPNVLLVSSRTPFSIAVVDPVTNNVASGVKDSSFRVSDVAPSTAAFAAYAAPFATAGADVNKVVEFFSRDNVLNAEITKSSTVLLDSTPPEIVLLSPASCDSGLCRVLKGRSPVLGTARDLHFANYQLEFAAGQNASAGFTLISSGTAAGSSNTLAVWDATALAGWFTLRLTATDLVLNGASVAINVFVGDPGELLTLGNHEVFNMPEGVAAGADGKIYVADRDNSRIAVFSSTGALLASFGVRGHDDDDQRLSTGTLRLHEPSGVAVDADGSIYVADTGHDRVLKLSATGQILLSLGRREHEQEGPHDDRAEDHDRRLPGRFHEPAGVAVDAAQNIFVADTDNRRVQVFNSTGGFSFQFDLPPVPARTGRDDDDDRRDDHDDAGRAVLGKPFGIALDAAGNIYVADPKGGRALKFGATGQLLLTIPIAGDAPGSWGRPFGVAVSASGDCLLVSDRKYSRILKFDFQGSQNLTFGMKGRLHDDAPAPSGTLVFRKPMGLALDAAGNLFIADRNNDRIRKFGLPTGRPPLVVPPPKPEDDHSSRDVVDKEDGGKVERKDRAAVEIPAGAVVQDMKVTVSTPTAGAADASSRQHAVDAAQLKTASPPVEYGPEGTKFAAPVTLTLPYSPDLVALEGVDEADLTVRYWNRDKAQWENLNSTVDPKTHTVKAKTTHFSLYQVFSGTASAAGLRPLAVGDPTFMFHDVYAFPNPVRGVGAVTIRVQPGLADSVEVRVYDLAGRKVYSSANFSLNTGLDDGNGKGFQYTYDHVWDISGAGSGVYQYVITAKKSGQTDIHKAGRIGVVK